jgi:hypothetical protein
MVEGWNDAFHPTIEKIGKTIEETTSEPLKTQTD